MTDGGFYLECDKCKATLGVEAVPALKHLDRPRDWRALQDYAREIGWTGSLSFHWSMPDAERGNDRCPACSEAPPISDEGTKE